ncbi:MAG TPA: DUF1499 domain-containing protein [Candidatus Binatia bacterium]|nr:DUF1499 domain-containing protein [Candidatus Binatia bacterium]
MFKLRGQRPKHLGVHDGRLAPTVAKPNNVSSQADAADREHRVAPLAFKGDPNAAFARLRHVVAAQPRVTIVTQETGYLYAEFESGFFGFVDDVELLLDRAAGVIHVRSASRLGYSDLGANRKRVEQLRAAFAAAGG